MTIKELKDLLNDEDFNDDMEIVVGLSGIQKLSHWSLLDIIIQIALIQFV